MLKASFDLLDRADLGREGDGRRARDEVQARFLTRGGFGFVETRSHAGVAEPTACEVSHRVESCAIFASGRSAGTDWANRGGDDRVRTSVPHEDVARLDAGFYGEDLIAFEPFHECACPLLRCEADAELTCLVPAESKDTVWLRKRFSEGADRRARR